MSCNFWSQFTQWLPYEHRVRAKVNGKLVPVPINIDTVNILYDLKLDTAALERFFAAVVEKRPAVRTAEDAVVTRVGRDLYEKLFRSYTRKQWGLDPSELDAAVTARIPVRTDHDDRYFTDTFQMMPRHGYTRMFENMLDHPNIHIQLGSEMADMNLADFREVVYTGLIDAFFDYRFGELPYRSLRFEHRTLALNRSRSSTIRTSTTTHASPSSSI